MSRLFFIVPGHLLHSVLEPVIASLAFTFLLSFAAGWFLLQTLKRFHGPQTAFLGATVMLLNPYFHVLVSHRYPDAGAVVYLMGGIWLLFAPPQRLKRSVALISAGAMFASAAYCHLASGLVIASTLPAYFFYSGRFRVPDIAKDVGALAVGVIISTLLLGLLRLLYRNKFWIFHYQFVTAWERQGSEIYAYHRRHIAEWLPTAFRLGAFVAPAIMAAVFLVCRAVLRSSKAFHAGRMLQAAVVFHVVALFLFPVNTFVNGSLELQIPYLCTFLLVPVFLTTGLLIG